MKRSKKIALAANRNIITVGIPSRDEIHLAGHWYPCEKYERFTLEFWSKYDRW